MRRFATVIIGSILLASAGWGESPEHSLRRELKDKTVLIRRFFQDDRLEYTAEGEVMGQPKPGSWTVAKLQVKSISVRPDRIEIRGKRVITFLDQSTGQFATLKPSKKRTIRIKVHVPATLDSQHLDTLIHKVLVTEPKPDISIFPSYWREFLSGRVIRVKDKDGKLVFKRRDLVDAEARNDDQPVYTNLSAEPVFRVTKTMEAPKIVYQIDPEFSESARAQQFSGTAVVSFEVDKSGAVRDIQVVQPIGYGLDDEAVRAVEQWRFSPATRNGEPVSVLTNAEVSFRLY